MATEAPTAPGTDQQEPPPPPPAQDAPPPQKPAAPPADDQRQQTKKGPIGFGKAGVILSTLAELWRFAEVVWESGLAPRGLDTVAKITIAIQFGAEFGVPPMASIRGVAVINGMPGWKGDMALALVRASGKCADYEARLEGEGDEREAVVVSRRADSAKPMVTRFSVEDAKTAGLWGMTGKKGDPMPWTQYPERMLHYRALGFNLRDNFPEVMMGTATAEELGDYNVIDVQATSSSSEAAPARPALAAAPPPDELLVSLGLQGQQPTPAEVVAPTRKAKKAAATTPMSAPSVDPAVCEHKALPPIRLAGLQPGKSMTCPDCHTDLHGDPIQ